MRKLFMTVTMLIVPTLAMAWTMPVKVTNTTAGISAGNAVLVNYSTGMSTPTHYNSGPITAGTKYVYPPSDVSTVKVTIQMPANLDSVTVANAPVTPVNGIVTVARSTQTTIGVNVAYATAATAQKRSVMVTQTANGLTSLSIGSSSTTVGYTDVPVGTVVTVKAQPNANSSLTGLTVTGSTLVGSTFTVDNNTTVVATYVTPATISATLSLAASGQIGTPVIATVAASGAANLKYAWNGALPVSTNTYTFTPAAGANPVTVVVSGDNAPSVTRSATIQGVDLLAAANYTCTSCHSGSTPAVVNAYKASGHADASYSPTCVACHSNEAHAAGITAANIDTATYKILSNPVSVVSHGNTTVLAKGDIFCTGCHNGTHGIPHPLTGLGNTCAGCHSSSGDAHGIKKLNHGFVGDSDATSCGTCHGSMPPHYGGTAFVEAQYVSDASLPVSCANCHGTQVYTTVNQAILEQFTSSAHGSTIAEAWRHYDWRSSSRATCQRCHAGTAFVAKLGKENDTTNAYQSGDILKPGEVLNCSACHTDSGTGVLRGAAQQFTIIMTNAATVTYDVPGASTLCARCHGGRETGDSIRIDPSTTGIRGFIDSHYLPAAGTLYNKGGYEYAGQSYDSLGYHKNIGTGVSGTGSQGPCVACHMGLGTANHTWKAETSNGCGNCHSNPTTAKLAEAKASYAAALDGLRLALEAKGIYFDPAHPDFFTAPYAAGGTNTVFTNWAGPYGVASWKDVMGAAFNYNLLVNEPGAYAHNKQYALKLIADSCDFLADGSVDGEGIPAAVTSAINSVAYGLK